MYAVLAQWKRKCFFFNQNYLFPKCQVNCMAESKISINQILSKCRGKNILLLSEKGIRTNGRERIVKLGYGSDGIALKIFNVYKTFMKTDMRELWNNYFLLKRYSTFPDLFHYPLIKSSYLSINSLNQNSRLNIDCKIM